MSETAETEVGANSANVDREETSDFFASNINLSQSPLHNREMRIAADADSPPQSKVITVDKILERGCPKVPHKKKEFPVERRRLHHRALRQPISLNINHDGDKGSVHEEGQRKNRSFRILPAPRRLFPSPPRNSQIESTRRLTEGQNSEQRK